jgi:prophage tail gpP-like protein
MTVLTQGVDLRFGNLRYESHAVALTADLGLLPGVNHIHCRLPAGLRFEATPGDVAEIALDNGETQAEVLTGIVHSVSRSPSGIEIVAVDAGARLAAIRPAKTFNAVTAVEVIRDLAAEAGAELGPATLTPEPLAVYLADQARSGAEHVANLAMIAGGIAFVEADGKLAVQARPQPPASAALRYGRELIEVATQDLQDPPNLALIGFGPAGAGGDPRALLSATEAIEGDAEAAAADSLWRPAPVLRSPAAQRAATGEARARRAARSKRMSATCWLQPQLRPGRMIEVQDLPEGLSGGPWLLTSVVHSVDRGRGGRTRFEAVSGEGGGLLGALTGAIGGLL